MFQREMLHFEWIRLLEIIGATILKFATARFIKPKAARVKQFWLGPADF